MDPSRFLVAISVLLVALGAAPMPTAAQQTGRVSDEQLRLFTNLGRFLYAYDQAAGRASEMLLSEDPDTSRLSTYIARQHRDGHWTVGFGKLSGDGSTFRLAYEVVLNENRRVDSLRAFQSVRRTTDDFYAKAARAMRRARDDFTGTARPYNIIVVPGGSRKSRFTLYVLPAQTRADVYRLGGDMRYEVDVETGKIVSKARMHDALLEIGRLPPTASGSAHKAPETNQPVETDVFFTMTRRPRAPHFVLAGQWVYRIAPDGTITPIQAASFDGRADLKVFSEAGSK